MADTKGVSKKAALGRRERNKQRVRKHLYETALKLFTEKGYERTSVDEIAEEADVARGTFFNHFQRKEDLITAWGENRRSRLQEGFGFTQDPGPGSLHDELERCMEILAKINEEERDVTQAMLMAWVKAGRPLQEQPFAGELFAEIIESARKHGEVPTETNALRVGYFLRDAYLGTLYRWSRSGEECVDLHTELKALCSIALHGIAAPQPSP
jgi:TetR/AcrR family transcriptional regulator, cholesterol catabolism regulator